MATDASWDLVVIGAGTAGMVAARTAVRLGARTLLVESERPGGDCLWTGCVPSKALIAAASAAYMAQASAFLGVSGRVVVDFAAVMRHVHDSIARIAPTDSVDTLERAGVRVLTGRARFMDASTLRVDDQRIEFGRAVIATGASARLPPILGLDPQSVLTTETFWGLDRMPARLLVIGGGPVGCELAQAMARLGSRVTLVQRAPRLLSAEDPRASLIVLNALETDGVRVLLAAEVTAFDADAAVVRLPGGGTERIGFDRVLAATGRAPRTAGFGLADAGVETDADGAVVTDAQLRTSHPSIWAAGDVTALPKFTHTASANGEIAATNAVTGSALEVDPVVARVTYTSPEVASVGSLSATAWFDHADVDRAIVDGETAGFTSLAIDGAGVVRGATIVGPRAGETLGELALAVRLGLTTEQLARTTHAYPGYGYAVRKLALTDVRARTTPRSRELRRHD